VSAMGTELDGAVIKAPNGTDWAVLRKDGVGAYLVVSADGHESTIGRVSDLRAMALVGPDDRRYRVYGPVGGEIADLATLENIAVRFAGRGATLVLPEGPEDECEGAPDTAFGAGLGGQDITYERPADAGQQGGQ
jgi:hypothetical protein